MAETAEKAPETSAVPGELSREELVQRIVHTALLPAVRIAAVFGLPLKDVGDLLQMAYFHETRRRGLKMREASALLDVSMRKVALLSKRLKQNFLDDEAEHGIPRRIEFMLWAEPLSEARLGQVMVDVEPDEIRDALELLESQGRIELDESVRTPVWRASAREFRLVRDTILARIDGLGNLLGSVANVIFGRFFQGDSNAFARTLNLRVRKADLPELQALYEQLVWQRLAALDEAAHGDPDAVAIDFNVIWGPHRQIDRAVEAADPRFPIHDLVEAASPEDS